MKKLIGWAGGSTALFLMLFYFTQTAAANMAMPIFDFEVQSRSDDAKVKQGEQVILWVVLKNTGINSDWYANSEYGTVHLGTSNPKDRASQFYTPDNWLTPNRVNEADTPMAAPGESMTFGWYMSVPAYTQPGVYQECFAPVVENWEWMREDGRLCWNIYVEANNNLINSYQAEIDYNMSQRTVDLAPGGEAKIEFQAKNTGGSTWYRQGQYPIHVATYNPKDRESSFMYTSMWLAHNRPTGLSQDMVAPGETGNFVFSIKAPDDIALGSYEESFWLVAENLTWLGIKSLDSGSPWFKVNINIIDDNSVSLDNSTLAANKETIKGDGKDKAQITVTLKTAGQKLITDKAVKLIGKGCDIDPEKGCWDLDIPEKLTDAKGEAVFDFSYNGEANFIILAQIDETNLWNWLEIAADNSNSIKMCGNEECFLENLDKCSLAAYNEISPWLGNYVVYEKIVGSDDQDRCLVETQFIEFEDADWLDKTMRCAYESVDEYPILFDESLCEGDLMDYYLDLLYGDFDSDCSTNTEVGDSCEGGYYLNNNLIVAPGGCGDTTDNPFCFGEDSLQLSWGGYGMDYGADSQTDGWFNSQQVYGKKYVGEFADDDTTTYAINFCWDLELNGYNDWYLPAIDQLEELYKHQDIIPGVALERYWSSTENLDTQEAPKYFAEFRGMAENDFSSSTGKGFAYYIRCVRNR